jgi:arylsulfatase
MDADRSEMHDFSAEHPGLVAELAGLWSEWADRCGVVPWEDLLALRKAKREAR